ncbi:MAG: molybdopterin adenylyltransferase [Candidatus Margulisiibacteriota bacterium]
MKVGIITVSDKGSQGLREDLSGPAIKDAICRDTPWRVSSTAIIPDEQSQISAQIVEMADQEGCDLIFTTGGTGLSPRDVTPEATRAVVDREIPGIAEAMRMGSMKNKKSAILSRAIAGTRGKSLMINLPGSPRAVKECLEIIMPVIAHALEVLQKGSAECGND